MKMVRFTARMEFSKLVRVSSITDDDLIIALEKALPELADEHDAAATPWNPHDWIPWDAGKNFAFLDGEDFTAEEGTDNAELRAAFLALLLTKDNLPSYHRIIALYFPNFSDWRRLTGTWTAEDDRHAIALRDFLVVRRLIDPVDAENRRLTHVTAGYRQESDLRNKLGPLDVLALLALHELQCVKFIDRLLTIVDDTELATVLRKIRGDDALQAANFLAFLNVGLTADPEKAVFAVERALSDAQPIGYDVADFDDERALLADYSSAQVTRAIAADFVSALSLEGVGGLSESGEHARQQILGAAA